MIWYRALWEYIVLGLTCFYGCSFTPAVWVLEEGTTYKFSCYWDHFQVVEILQTAISIKRALLQWEMCTYIICCSHKSARACPETWDLSSFICSCYSAILRSLKKINVQNTDVKKRGIEVRCCHFDHQNVIFNPSVSCPLLPRRFWISWFLGLRRSTRLARRAHCTNPSLCVRNAMQRDLYLCALFTARVLISYLCVESIALCGKRALKNEPQHILFFLNLRSKNENRL